MIILTYLGYSVLAFWFLWVFYLAVMRLQQVRDAGKMTGVGYVLGWSVLLPGWALDILVNWFVVTVLLLELPRWKEFEVTARFKRLKNDTGWRGKVVRWFAHNLLDAYDPSGTHV